MFHLINVRCKVFPFGSFGKTLLYLLEKLAESTAKAEAKKFRSCLQTTIKVAIFRSSSSAALHKFPLVFSMATYLAGLVHGWHFHSILSSTNFCIYYFNSCLTLISILFHQKLFSPNRKASLINWFTLGITFWFVSNPIRSFAKKTFGKTFLPVMNKDIIYGCARSSYRSFMP